LPCSAAALKSLKTTALSNDGTAVAAAVANVWPPAVVVELDIGGDDAALRLNARHEHGIKRLKGGAATAFGAHADADGDGDGDGDDGDGAESGGGDAPGRGDDTVDDGDGDGAKSATTNGIPGPATTKSDDDADDVDDAAAAADTDPYLRRKPRDTAYLETQTSLAARARAYDNER
jgi:hypothetical protein